MSPTGALVISLVAVFALGALAAWLLNVPLLAIGIFAAIGGLLTRRVFRQLSRSRARQDTEAPVDRS